MFVVFLILCPYGEVRGGYERTMWIVAGMCRMRLRNRSSFHLKIFYNKIKIIIIKQTKQIASSVGEEISMVVFIAGSSHTGKTLLAQNLLEKYKYPYLSIDHLKMGLIRSGQTTLTPQDDSALTGYLWPIVREIVKTAIENNQNLIVEGCYIPFDWKNSFSAEYLGSIRYYCLIMTESYIENHFSDIQKYANTIETRLHDSGITPQKLIEENALNLKRCKQYGYNYLLIDSEYHVDIDLSSAEAGI